MIQLWLLLASLTVHPGVLRATEAAAATSGGVVLVSAIQAVVAQRAALTTCISSSVASLSPAQRSGAARTSRNCWAVAVPRRRPCSSACASSAATAAAGCWSVLVCAAHRPAPQQVHTPGHPARPSGIWRPGVLCAGCSGEEVRQAAAAVVAHGAVRL